MRLLFVLSSFAPLFVLWAVKGTSLVPDKYFVPLCIVLVLVPTWVLWRRIRVAREGPDQYELTLGPPRDQSQYLIGYLFAILLPFYRQHLESWRDLSALVLAVAFIVFLFWNLKLYHLNIVFRAAGYSIYAIGPRNDQDDLGRGGDWILLTRRKAVHMGCKVTAHRITDTMFIDTGE
ncbi:MAG: hypothetical protein F4023_11870 [Acidobacteria bacterium]|nr:hypothetical protein [Acidobacteriota bacterium]MYH50771.1 hypothetical protein [Gammaproteobacteria bacterium]MYK80337.1 hypothetical protein [Acidobacteriota bacterium]